MGQRPQISGSRGAHGGVIFTPALLAERLAAPLALGEHPLLDPACGDGALLVAALKLSGGSPEGLARLRGLEIDPTLAERARARLAAEAGVSVAETAHLIRCADALAPETEWARGAAILANPPWLSFSGRHAGKRRSGTASQTSGGWPSLQGAFLERIAEHCAAEDARARVLVPGSLLELERYRPLRHLLRRRVHFGDPPVELGERAFVGVTEPAVILDLLPGAGEWTAAARSPDAEDGELLRRLSAFPTLPPESFADPGVHTGNSAVQLLCDDAGAQTAPIRRGADLKAFHLAEPSLHVRLDLERTAEQRFRIAGIDHYQSFPILIRQTANRPIAALHRSPTYFRNSLLGARPPADLEPEFLVALLNSTAAAYWHQRGFRDARQSTFPQVKVGHLRTLPTPITRRAEDSRFHDEVVARVRHLEPGHPGFEDRRRALDALFLGSFGLPPSLRIQARGTPRSRGASDPI